MAHDSGFLSTAGVWMPPLIYGTAWKERRTADLVVQAVRAGFRGIDTACQPKHYHEAGVGEALERLAGEGIARESLFLQTKFTPLEGHDPRRIPYDPHAPISGQVARSFELSLQNLRSGYVDSLVLHAPPFPYANLLGTWRAMERIALEGGARQLGISNCYDLERFKRLYDDAAVKPAVVQNRFYADSGYDAELRLWCREQGIIYQGFWTLTANPLILDSRLLRTLATKYDKTVVQIFYNFLHRSGIIPLDGTTSPEHMASDLESFGFMLSDEELSLVKALLR